LAKRRGQGRPRQVDLRRAISAAYYALFHAVLGAAADEFVGTSKRGSKIHTLAYRSVDHKRVKDICSQLDSGKLSDYAPPSGFTVNLLRFAAVFKSLQEERHSADYDPEYGPTAADADAEIAAARKALERFRAAPAVQRRTFLGLLLFKPR